MRAGVLFALVAFAAAFFGGSTPSPLSAGPGQVSPVWATDHTGLWRSLDGGETWDRLRPISCPQPKRGFVKAASADLVVYNDCNGNIWSTENGLAPSPDWVNEGTVLWAGDPQGNSEGVVLVDSDGERIYRRDPAGTWDVVFQRVDIVGDDFAEYVSEPALLGNVAYLIHAREHLAPPFQDSTEIWRSTDAGETWTLHKKFFFTLLKFPYDLEIDPDDSDRVYIAHDGLMILDGMDIESTYSFGNGDGNCLPDVTSIALMPTGDLLTAGIGCDASGGWPVMTFRAGEFSPVDSAPPPGGLGFARDVTATADGSLYLLTQACCSTFNLWARHEDGSWVSAGPSTSAFSMTAPYSVDEPAVMVLHGMDSDCGAVEDLRERIRDGLGVPDALVQCFKTRGENGYHPPKGAAVNADALDVAIAAFRDELDLPTDQPVHLVAHSFGGIVARWYLEEVHTQADGRIGSISMLGTPNRGAYLADVVDTFCAGDYGFWCDPLQAIGLIPEFNDEIDDMETDSSVVKALGANEPPQFVAYRSEAGLGGNATYPAWVIGWPNDCLVSYDSAAGNDFITREYLLLVHTNSPGIGCEDASQDEQSGTLLNNDELAGSVVNTIVGLTGQVSPPVTVEGAGQPREKDSAQIVVQPSQPTAVASFTTVSGDPATSFATYWPASLGGF
jgi:hypothetical protein